MDMMREMILALEHMAANPIVVDEEETVSSSVGICKEIYLITVGLTEANVATVLAGWLSK